MIAMDEGMPIEDAVISVFEEAARQDNGPVTQETTFGELGITKLRFHVALVNLELAFGAEPLAEGEQIFSQGSGKLGDLIKKFKIYLPAGARVRAPKKVKPTRSWYRRVLQL